MSSYWIDSTKNLEKESKINNDCEADVCIIGAGITGLSTGYYLSKNGLKVIVVDKDLIGEKTSGHTTAKITLQHGLIYNYLINSYGKEFAFKYFESNKNAISNIKKIIENENIECDFEEMPNIIYTNDKNEVIKILNEINAINQLNKDFATFINKSDLPFEIEGGIKIENQAQFHPRKYMYGLADAIKKNNGYIFTNSKVEDVKKQKDKYITYVENNKIKSKYVVIASHYPFINFPGFYFSKMYQVTSYAIGIETNKQIPYGMYINSNEPTLSFRSAKNGEKNFLIIGGGNHKTGYSPESDINFGYSFLENEIKKIYDDYKILYKWNTRDCVTLDKIPYIGNFSNYMENIYVATGFNKWGMTSSNVAANIIADVILENKNSYKEIYSSTRFKPIKNKDELKNMSKQTINSFVMSRIKIPEESLYNIKNDNGGIVRIEGKAVGIYKDKNGKTYAVDPTCTHLGCLLTWNNIDKTWDCPCHGSRFNYLGKNLYEPAIDDLKNYDIE